MKKENLQYIVEREFIGRMSIRKFVENIIQRHSSNSDEKLEKTVETSCGYDKLSM